MKSSIRHSLQISVVFVGMFGLAPTAIGQQAPESQISVPVSIRLTNLAAYADSKLPASLHNQTYRRTCVEPERACTKVPEFRGLKVTFKNRCAEISPRITCDISETVARQGSISVSGNGPSIIASQQISGSGTVRGTGDIGRHIRQTVRASAEVVVTATPGLNADWSPMMPVSIGYRWLQRPEFRLFNLFPVTLGSTLGPPLDAAIRDFEQNSVPQELAKLDIRSQAEKLWSKLQDPIPLELSEGRFAYLHLRPLAVGLDGPRFDGGELSARLTMTLQARVDENRDGAPRTGLPNLTPVADNGFSLVVPIVIGMDGLNAVLTDYLPRRVDLETSVAGIVEFTAVEVMIAGEKLVFDMTVSAEGGPLAALPSQLRIEARPMLDTASEEITFTDIDLSAAGSGLGTVLQNAALAAAELFLSDTVRLAFGEEIGDHEAALNHALNSPLTDELTLSGSGDLSIAELRLDAADQSLEVLLVSTGAVAITGFDPIK